jgi:hypothetical protein
MTHTDRKRVKHGLFQVHRDRAILKTTGAALQSYRRRPVEVGRVVIAWEQIFERLI